MKFELILYIFITLILVICICTTIKPENFNEKYINNNKYIFSKIVLDNRLYLIFPVYDNEIKEKEFEIELEDYEFSLIKEIKKIENEPIHIFIYDIKSTLCETDIVTGTFKYKNNLENFSIYPIFTDKKHKLAITTLFKDDYNLFPLFYDYYKKQGVSLFIMYYNGIANDKIKNIFNYPDVILINWNYKYWNPSNIKYRHHAQIGQLHDCLYKYAKPMSEYIIYCDLDEYLHISNQTLLKFIENNSNLDVIEFNNYFAKTFDEKIPSVFPKRIKIGNKHYYKNRSKNIYKTLSIKTVNIHFPHEFNKTPNISKDHRMFHFQSWSNRNDHDINNIFTLK